MREENYPRPVSDPESEGLPRTADDDSTAWDDAASPREADGPDPAALPSDRPLAVDRYGVTPEEARLGESVAYKLGREQREWTGEAEVADDEGAALDDETDRPGLDAGLYDAPTLPSEGPASEYDVPADRPVGRLVGPDEGAHEDTEPDAVAFDAGADGGGASAEELAMHEVDEP